MEKVTQPEPRMVRVVYGLPDRMDRLAAFGNAVVLQVVEAFGLAVMAAHPRNFATPLCRRV